jgi:hypothetical protein
MRSANAKEIAMSEERSTTAEERSVSLMKDRKMSPAVRIGIYIVVALVIFLLGLIPMWLKASAAASQREAAQRELHLSRMQNMLASSAVDAQRGEYEPARQEASDFFTALREQLDKGETDATLTAPQREGLKPLLPQRDDLITLLARSDPAAGPRLLDMHAAFRKAILSVPPENKKAP